MPLIRASSCSVSSKSRPALVSSMHRSTGRSDCRVLGPREVGGAGWGVAPLPSISGLRARDLKLLSLPL